MNAIYGVGIDLLAVPRIAGVNARHPKRFAARLLHPREQAALGKSRDRARFLAKAFAAKEAFVKALGTGFRGVAHTDVGLVRGKLGRPQLVFSKVLSMKLDRLGIGGAHVSLSDEGDLVCAMVLLERRRESNK